MKRLIFYLLVSLCFVSCNTKGMDYYNADVEDLDYSTIPGDIFDKLPIYKQYAVKYKHQPDSVIKVPLIVKDTIYNDAGNMLKEDYKKTYIDLVLANDSMIFFLPYKSEPMLIFSVNDNLYYNKESKFKSYFDIKFNYSKKDKYYYLLKEDLPTLAKSKWSHYDLKSIRIEYKPSKKSSDVMLDIKNDEYSYRFKDTYYIYKNELGKNNPDHDLLILEHNDITAFIRWNTNDKTVVNSITAKK